MKLATVNKGDDVHEHCLVCIIMGRRLRWKIVWVLWMLSEIYMQFNWKAYVGGSKGSETLDIEICMEKKFKPFPKIKNVWEKKFKSTLER